MKKFSSKIAAVLVLILAFSVFASACTFGFLRVNVASIKFAEDVLTMEVGQEIEMVLGTDIVITPAMASDKGFRITSSNETVVKVSSTNRLIAKSQGNAVLKVESTSAAVSDSLNVTVLYSRASDISVEAKGKTVQLLNALSDVELSVSAKETIDPATVVTWKVNGGAAATLTYDTPFVFEPSGVGSFEITASLAGKNGTLSAAETVMVFEPFAASPVFECDEADLSQEADAYRTAQFNVRYDNPASNPAAKVEWFVNGELKATNSDSFGFLPKTAGKFEISCYVNGQPAVNSTGGDSYTVKAKGTVVPTNVRLDYDNDFPSVYVRWDSITAPVGYQISIVNAATGMEVVPYELSTRNTQTAGLFSGSSFDATSVVNAATGPSIFKNSFKIRVKTLSDSEGIFAESDFSAAITTPVINSGARVYLEKKYMGNNKNYYITSDEEFYDVYKYMLIWRGNSTVTTKVFMAYSFGDKDELVDKAFNYAGITGLYGISAEVSDYILTFGITFKTENLPTKQTNTPVQQGWDSTLPHVNYDKNDIRPAAYVFPIDRNSRTVSVSNSEQLYYVAEKGYRPVPQAGSDAEKIYNYAREVLRYIITDDMTDVEKAHAIYDWIMWRVSYDHAVIKVSELAESVLYKAYYLEGVFTDSYPFAVCDGMAKAFVLMANIEGLPCLRVVGTASSGGSSGGHAWNKVLLGGSWYIADCTWGDKIVEFRGSSYEFAGHEYFMLTDAEVAGTHFEDYSELYPRTTTVKYNWYNTKYDYESSQVDFYLATTGSALEEECTLLVDYLLSILPVYNMAAYYQYYVGAVRPGNWTKTTVFSLDLRVHPGSAAELKSLYNNPLMKAFASAGLTYNTHYSFSTGGDIIYLFMSIPKK